MGRKKTWDNVVPKMHWLIDSTFLVDVLLVVGIIK